MLLIHLWNFHNSTKQQ